MALQGFVPFLPKNLGEVLLGLAALDDAGFNLLLSEVRGPKGFDRDTGRCEDLATKLGVQSKSDVYIILTAIDFFYSNISQIKEVESEIPNIIDEVLGQFDEISKYPDKIPLIAARLTELVKSNPVVDRQEKLKRLKRGLLPNGISFSSFVDLRPDFTDDRSHISRIVPVIIFRVSTDSDADSDSSHIFQLTEETLRKLKVAVEDAEKKTQAVRSEKAFVGLIVDTVAEDK